MGKRFKHFVLVTKHRHQVLRNAFHFGIFFSCLGHDLSKYQPKEFFLSAKYFQGNQSPVNAERKANDQFSMIAIHHTRKNKHHYEYWVDMYRGNLLIKAMPFRYALEMVADMMAASKTYNQGHFSAAACHQFFEEREAFYLMHPATILFVKWCFLTYDASGWSHLKKKNTRAKYQDFLKRYPAIIKKPYPLNEGER